MDRNRGLLTGIAAMLLMSGSAGGSTPKPVEGLFGKTVMLVRRPTPDFMYLTGGSALAGAVSAAGPLHDSAGPTKTANTAGAAILADAEVDDPTILIGDSLFADLVSTYRLVPSTSGAQTVADGAGLEELRKQNRSDLIFEFYTENWRTFYFLFDFTHLDVWYYGKARLIDPNREIRSPRIVCP